MPVVTDYTALLSGDYWNGIEVTGKPVIVTYSFPTAAAGYLADVDGFTAATVSSFQAFNATEQTQARTALGEWAAASGLIFVEVAPGQGDINFQLVDFDTTSAPSYAGAGGIGFYPFGDWNFFTYPSFASDIDGSGDVFMNSQFASGGSVTYGTLLHEIGHAIGLKHPTEVVTNFAANPVVTHDQVLASDDPALTIMAEVGDPGVSDHLKTLDEQAAAFLYGPAGTGQVVTASASGANASVSSWAWNAATQTLTQTGFAGDDTVRGSSVKDIINGLDGNDRLFGLNGNDTLDGGAGDDLLNGGPGLDTLKGGTGDDTYMIDSSSDKVIELAGEGFDSVLSSVSYTLAANVELLQIFGAGLTGRGNALANTMFGDGSLGSKLYGLDGDDYMVGGSGIDMLDGGTGADTMFGGGGNDTYFVDNAGDVVREDSTAGVDDGGVDLVNASVSFTLGAFIENLTLTGTAAIDGTGNDLANTIKGNAADNVLDGGDGGDTLDGGAGNDTMRGGAGNDGFRGSVGADLYDGGAGTDVVNYGPSTGVNVFLDGSGTNGRAALGDTFVGIENLLGSLTGADFLVGAAGANRLTGQGGDDILWGRAGVDQLEGGDGNDRLVGGTGADVLAGGTGSDTFVFDQKPLLATERDRITDFASGQDHLEIDASVFGGGLVAGGTVDLVANANPSSAGHGAGTFLYNTGTGFLSYDIDGQGAGAAVTFAWLQNVPALTTGDFTIVA